VHSRYFLVFFACIAILALATACSLDAPSIDKIRDSKLFDRRISETPRQKIVRECTQESDRFRVGCVLCHTTDKIDEIKSEDPLLTKAGKRAQIMRESPSFGLNQDCSTCHQSKFKLNRNAEKLFGPGGERYQDALNELKVDK
jgi:hypothetical protein